MRLLYTVLALAIAVWSGEDDFPTKAQGGPGHVIWIDGTKEYENYLARWIHDRQEAAGNLDSDEGNYEIDDHPPSPEFLAERTRNPDLYYKGDDPNKFFPGNNDIY